jgi:hypothetical protein
VKQYSALSTNPHEADLNQAIGHHEKLVRWVARRQWRGGLPWADVLRYVPYHGAGRPYGVVACLAAFRPGAGHRFLQLCHPRTIWRAVTLAQRKPPEELTPHPPQEAPDLEAYGERVISYELLHPAAGAR